MSVKLPEDAQVGSKVEFVSVVNDEYRERPFENRFVVLVKPETTPSGGGGSRRKPPSDDDGKGREQAAGIALPNIVEVREEDWGKHGFDKFTALKIKDAGVGEQGDAETETVTRYDFFLNVDNCYLKTEIKGTRADVSLLQARFTYGMVLIGLGLLQQDMARESKQDSDSQSESGDDEVVSGGVEERVNLVSRALAPIILPMIESLGSLDVSDVDSASASGEAT